jgi:hypothetical protein
MFVCHEYRPMAASFSGACVWAILAMLAGSGHARFGVIELLLMFALLVIVPLGLELAPIVTAPGLPRMEQRAARIQPLAAVCAVAAFWFGPGYASGMLVVPWAAAVGLVALSGLAGISRSRSVVDVVGSIARLDLGIAGGWLLASRLGMRMGFEEPIVLLTAVHFHYSGFATALIAGSGARWAQSGLYRGWWERTALAVALLPFAVAAGFVFSPALRVVAVCFFSLAILSLAILLGRESRMLVTRTARMFLRTTAAVILAGMFLASAYAIGEYTHREWLTIPRMASTHGWINAIGFVLPGLLGWLVEFHAEPLSARDEPGTIRTRRIPGTLRPAFLARDFYDH